MGSFNTTCFASNQTIAPGDLARVIPVMQQGTYRTVSLSKGELAAKLHGIANSVCGPNAFWKPVAGFLPARYDDYGLFNLVLDTEADRSVARSFFMDVYRRGAKAEQGENACHDIPVDFEAFVTEKAPGLLALMQKSHRFDDEVAAGADNLDTELQACWKYISETVRQHRMFLMNDRETLRPLEFVVMHEDAYLALIASVEATSNWEKQSNAREAAVRRALAETRKRYAERARDADVGDFIFADTLSSELSRIGSEGNFNRIGLHRAIRPLTAGLRKGESDAEFLAAVLPHLADRYAFSGLEMLNLFFSPMVYAGQDYSNELGDNYLKFVKAVNKKVSAARKRDR